MGDSDNYLTELHFQEAIEWIQEQQAALFKLIEENRASGTKAERYLSRELFKLYVKTDKLQAKAAEDRERGGRGIKLLDIDKEILLQRSG